MLSRPHKPFGKGKQITADDLNWLKREATKILVGGPGMNVTRIGGRTVLSRVGSQSVNSRAQVRGHVYKLTHNLNYHWAWNAFDVGSFDTVYRVAANDAYVYALFRTAVYGTTDYPCNRIVQLRSTGHKNWSGSIGSGNSLTRQVATLESDGGVAYTNSRITVTREDDATVRSASNSSLFFGNISTATMGVNENLYREARGIVRDETSFWAFLSYVQTPYEARLCEFDEDGTILTDTALSGGAGGPFWLPNRLAKNGSTIYAAGGYNTVAYPSGSATPRNAFFSVSTAGALQWKFYAGAVGAIDNFGQDVCVDLSGNAYCAAWRTNNWTGASGNYASLWKISHAGSVIDTWDSGDHLYGSWFGSDGYVYVCGERTNTWPGADDYANVWQLDTNLNVVSTFDTGKYATGSEDGTAYGINETESGVFVCCEWDGVAP